MKLEPNTTMGQYRVVRLLGRGGMGEVYEVHHLTLGRAYALKLLPEDFAGRPEALGRFRREARVMANLEHPNIVRVDEFGEVEGRYWLRMDLVRGVEPEVITLGDYAAARGGRLEEGEFVPLLRQLLSALAYAHEKGVVHRDLKPGNVLLEQTKDGSLQVKVSDFGLARVVGEELIRSMAQLSVSRSMGLGASIGTAVTLGAERSIGNEKTLGSGEEGTSTRALLGTWEYMSPEQQRGEEADARSDIYAVGLMCYRLLTGRELGLKKTSQLNPDLRPAWDGFVARAIDQEASDRYADGRQMLEALAPVDQAVRQEQEVRRQQAEEQRRHAEEQRQREEEAARQRAEETAMRARGEGYVLEEAQAAQAWEEEEGRKQREAQTLALQAVQPRKKGALLSAGAMLKFGCPHCAQHLEAEPQMARREITCPVCRGLFLIPPPPPAWTRGWKRLTSLVKQKAGGRAATAMMRLAGLLRSRRVGLGVAVGVVVLGLAGAGAWWWTSWRHQQGNESHARTSGASVQRMAAPSSGALPASTTCVNHLKLIGLAFRQWSMDNADRFPFSITRRQGGSAEYKRLGSDGFDANAAAHFQVMSNVLTTPNILVCPADTKMPAMDFRSLKPDNVSYQLRSGLAVDPTQPEEVLACCPIHHHVLLCDGTVIEGQSPEARSAREKFATNTADAYSPPAGGASKRSPVRRIPPEPWVEPPIEYRGTYVTTTATFSNNQIVEAIMVFRSSTILPTGDRYFGCDLDEFTQAYGKVSPRTIKGLKGRPGRQLKVPGAQFEGEHTLLLLTHSEPIF